LFIFYSFLVVYKVYFVCELVLQQMFDVSKFPESIQDEATLRRAYSDLRRASVQAKEDLQMKEVCIVCSVYLL